MSFAKIKPSVLQVKKFLRIAQWSLLKKHHSVIMIMIMQVEVHPYLQNSNLLEYAQSLGKCHFQNVSQFGFL